MFFFCFLFIPFQFRFSLGTRMLDCVICLGPGSEISESHTRFVKAKPKTIKVRDRIRIVYFGN